MDADFSAEEGVRRTALTNTADTDVVHHSSDRSDEQYHPRITNEYPLDQPISSLPPNPSPYGIPNSYPHHHHHQQQQQQQQHQQQQQIPYQYPSYHGPIHPYPYSVPSLHQQSYYQPPFLPPATPPTTSTSLEHSNPQQQHRSSTWRIPTTTTAFAVTAGTILGLSVAATVRWLNGDDWYVVAASSSPNTTVTSSTSPDILSENHTVDDTPTVKSESRQVTDQAMDFLRQQQQQQFDCTTGTVRSNTTSSTIEKQLQEIQQSLRHIQNSIAPPPPPPEPPNSDSCHLDMPSQQLLSSVLIKLDRILDIYHTVGETLVTVPPNIHDTKEESIPEDVVESIKDPDPMVVNNELAETHIGASNIIIPPPAVVPVTLTSTKATLIEALTTLVLQRPDTVVASPNDYLAGIQSLYLFTLNISRQPHVPRYRRIYCDNEHYRNHVVPLGGASELLLAVGFVPSAPSTSHPRRRLPQRTTSKYWEWVPLSSPTQSVDEVKDMEHIYLERLREAVVALETIKMASHDADNNVLLQQALTAARLMDNTTVQNADNDTMDNLVTASVSAKTDEPELSE